MDDWGYPYDSGNLHVMLEFYVSIDTLDLIAFPQALLRNGEIVAPNSLDIVVENSKGE